MPGILWGSPEEKDREWLFALKKLSPQGKVLPNGTKLRRKDHSEALKHSFMIIDDRIIAISGKGIYLGEGRSGHAKLAEDEDGNLIALKIITKKDFISNSITESLIAYDLGIAGKCITRTSTSKKFSIKHYIAYQYLGTPLINYLYTNKSLDKRYELCIKISLALHEIHTGKKAKSKKGYRHNDIHWGNLVIDEQGEPHFIDFGKAREASRKNKNDIFSMLSLFFTPLIKKENISIYLNSGDENAEGAYSIIRYSFIKSDGTLHRGSLNLNDMGLDNVKPKRNQLNWFDLNNSQRAAIEKAISHESRYETLFSLLKDSTAFSKTSKVPKALDIAETLTLCRLQLEAFQELLRAQSAYVRLEVIQILNFISPELLNLYEQLRTLPKADVLDKLVKNYIFCHLLASPKEISADFLDFLNLQLDDTPTIKKTVATILGNINYAKKAYRAKNKPNSHDEPDQGLQAKLFHDSLEVFSKATSPDAVEESIATANTDSPKPQALIPVIREELNTKNFIHPMQIANIPVIAPSELPESQEVQIHVEHTLLQSVRDLQTLAPQLLDVPENPQREDRHEKNGLVEVSIGDSFNTSLLPSVQPEQSEKTAEIKNKYSFSSQKIDSLTKPNREKNCFSSINMQILGGFIAVVGIAAVAVAFTVLTGWTIPVIAGIGIAAIIVGFGLFAKGSDKKSPDNLPNLVGEIHM